MSTHAFIQRLQKHYAYFKRQNGEKLPAGCSSIELIDEDDIKSWFVQLAYKDENGSDFFISLRINFSDEGIEYLASGKIPMGGKNLHNHSKGTLRTREYKNDNPLILQNQDQMPSATLASCSPSVNDFVTALEAKGRTVMMDKGEGNVKGDGSLMQLNPVTTTSEVSSNTISCVATLGLRNSIRKSPDKVVYTRMPAVLVICPRLNASFIHHGVVCSLELMSQCWEHTEENVALLITTLYHTLNPFDGTSRVSVGVVAPNASFCSSVHLPYGASSYTDEEHRDGLRFIARSHPHLFRQVTQQDVTHSYYLENLSTHKSGNEIVNEYSPSQAQEQEGVKSSSKHTQWLRLSTISEVKYAIYQGIMRQPSHSTLTLTDTDDNLKSNASLKDFKATLNIVALLRHIVDLSHARRDDHHVPNFTQLTRVGENHREESLWATLALPRSLANVSHKLILATSKSVNLSTSSTPSSQATKTLQATPLQIVLDLLLPPCYSGPPIDSTVNGHHFPTCLDHRNHGSARVVKVHISGRTVDEDSKSEPLSRSFPCHFPVALALRQGKAPFYRSQGSEDLGFPPESETLLINTLTEHSHCDNDYSKDTAMVPHCIIIEGLSLTLSDVDVYGHLIVHGHLRLRNCRFIGTISCEMSGQVHIENCRIGIDVGQKLIDVIECINLPEENKRKIHSTELLQRAYMCEKANIMTPMRSSSEKNSTQMPHRYEGILILDTSRVEITEATLVSCAIPLSLPSVFSHTANQTISKGHRYGKSPDVNSLISGYDAVRLNQKGNIDSDIDPLSTINHIGKSDTLESTIASLLSSLASFSPVIVEKLHNRHLVHSELNCCSLPVLSALIFVSNNAKLFVHDSCLFSRPGPLAILCKRIIFAEQNACVDINHSTIVASGVSAVCIQGCQGLLHDVRITSWRHFTTMMGRKWTCSLGKAHENKSPHLEDLKCDGPDETSVRVAQNQTVLLSPAFGDTKRSTGLVVEQGGSLIARQCIIKGLYFGFSIMTFSVAHLHSCHASHVVNGYTVDASTATFENCSVWSNHVGVFVLNQAKCEIIEYSDDSAMGSSFDERCATVNQACCKTRQCEHPQRVQKLYQKCALRGTSFQSFSAHNVESLGTGAQRVELDDESESWTRYGFGKYRVESHSFVGKRVFNRGMRCYYGETYGVEVRGATMKARGITVINARCACVYAYPQYSGQPTRKELSDGDSSDNFENDVSVLARSEVDLQECIMWGLPTQNHSIRSEGAIKMKTHIDLKSCLKKTNIFPIDTLDSITKSTCKSRDFYENDVQDFNMASDISLIPTSLRTRERHLNCRSSSSCHGNCVDSYDSDKGCGVKLIESKAKLHLCFAVDLEFAFVVMQQATALFKECVAVRGYIGFMVKDNSVATLYDCGSYVRGISLLVQKHSHVDIDWIPFSDKEPAVPTMTSSSTDSDSLSLIEPVLIPLKQTKIEKNVSGFPTSVFAAGLNGIECKASVVRCHGITVLQMCGSAFNVHGGSILHTRKSLVDLSPEGFAAYFTQRLTKLEMRQGDGVGGKGVSGTVRVDHSDNVELSKAMRILGGCSCGTCHLQLFSKVKDTQDSASSHTIGVKAWSSSMCYVDDTEIRGGMYGVVAIGPEARVHAHRIHIWGVQHGLKVESAAQAEFLNCCINSLQEGVHISANARCLIQQGNYTGRLFGLVCSDGSLLRIKENVKINGFSRAGIYLHKSAIMETEKGSQLEVKEHCTDASQEQKPMNSHLPSMGGIEPCGLSVCVLLEAHANAMVHCAFLGGGAGCGIRAQSGAFGFFQYCVIQNVQLIGLHTLPTSIVYIGSGSTIDVLDAIAEDDEMRLRHSFGGAPDATIVASSLHAYPYSLVVERGAVCRFLPLVSTPQSLPDCWFNLPVRQPSNTCLTAIRSGVVCFLRVFDSARLITTLWGWIANSFFQFKMYQREQSEFLGTHTSRFFHWARSSLGWIVQTFENAYLPEKVLLHEGKSKTKVYFDRETKIAILSTKTSPSDTLVNNVNNKNDIQNMCMPENGSSFCDWMKAKHNKVYQCHSTWAVKSMRPTPDKDAFLPWITQMWNNKTPQQTSLLSTTSNISGRSVICGECSLCEVSLQLPMCPLPSTGALRSSLLATSRLFPERMTDPVALPEKEEDKHHHYHLGSALGRLESKDENDGYSCPCNAAMTVRACGALTLNRCSLFCLPTPPFISSASGLVQFDYHVVCCSGARARLHLCGAYIKLHSPQKGAPGCIAKLTRQQSPSLSVGPSYYSCNKMIIHAANKATVVLCCVTNEGLHSPLEPCAGVCKDGLMEASCCQTDPLMIPRNLTTVQHESSSEGGHTNIDTDGTCADFHSKITHTGASSMLSRGLIRISVHACGQSNVYIYRTFLHHLLAGHNSNLTVIQSAIVGPGSVTDIQSGAVLQTQQSLLLASLAEV
ncbi:unnamed protein product [Phytomonas sp. Hart1]|nr:unnamed protein product [Phytomonas sp. Hart1]|eukprot:CCW68868.1 unnamed protein product [Phytomonas sp. isolate Hart1]